METLFYYYDAAHTLKPFAYALPGQIECVERVPVPPVAPPLGENGHPPEGWTPSEPQFEEVVHTLALPDHAILAAPEERPCFWPVLNAAGDGWDYVEDHRQKKDEHGCVVEGTGTPYWLTAPHGEDDWRSPPRYMTDIGPLPPASEGALLTRPEKPLAVAQEEKRQEIARAHGEVLSYLLAESPHPTAVEAALAVEDMRADDPEGLGYVRGLADNRRAELLAAVDAAGSVAEVEAITVSYPV